MCYPRDEQEDQKVDQADCAKVRDLDLVDRPLLGPLALQHGLEDRGAGGQDDLVGGQSVALSRDDREVGHLPREANLREQGIPERQRLKVVGERGKSLFDDLVLGDDTDLGPDPQGRHF